MRARDVARGAGTYGATHAAAMRIRVRFLFGAFGIADAMYAPVVMRFISYDVCAGGRSNAIMLKPFLRCRLCASGSPMPRLRNCRPSMSGLTP